MKLSLLKQRNFLLLMQGKFVSLLGSSMQTFALSLYVLNEYKSSTLFASILILGAIPELVLGPFAGVLVDWFDRKKIMVYSDLFSALLVGSMSAYAMYNGRLELWQVYFMVLSLSLVGVIFGPALSTVIPTIISKEDLYDANSINRTLLTFAKIVSPIVAGLLMGFASIGTIMTINAVSFFLSAISEMFIDLPKVVKKRSEMTVQAFKEDFVEGVRFVKDNSFLLNIMLISLVFNFTIAPVYSVAMPYILKVDMLISDIHFGIFESVILAASLVSPLLGSFISKKMSVEKIVYYDILAQPFIMVGIIGALLGSFTLVIYGFTTKFLLMLLLNGLAIIVVSIGNIAVDTVMQTVIPRELLGRVGTVMMAVGMAAMPLGQGLFGLVMDVAPLWIPLAVSAVGLFALAIHTKRVFLSKGQSGKVHIHTTSEVG